MKEKPKPRFYTVKEVERFRDRLRREHAEILDQARKEYYERGVADGQAKLRADLRALIGCDATFIESRIAARFDR